MKDFALHDANLYHKWGFGDGDALEDWWWEIYDVPPTVDLDDVLWDLVKEYLVPAIEEAGHTIEVIRIVTNHNPVRAETLDGKKVDWYSEDWELLDPPISLNITKGQIDRIIERYK